MPGIRALYSDIHQEQRALFFDRPQYVSNVPHGTGGKDKLLSLPLGNIIDLLCHRIKTSQKLESAVNFYVYIKFIRQNRNYGYLV